ncbi:MAG: hypothetical protein ACKOXP_06565 [Flavobacteriales bacterium]
MKKSLFLIFLFLFVSCETEILKGKKSQTAQQLKESSYVYLNDSTRMEKLVQTDRICLKLINANFHYSLLVDRKGKIDTIDFDQEQIETKTPELTWMNDNFICMTTFWTGPFISSLIIPVERSEKPFYYYQNGVHAHDETGSYIVYTDQDLKNSVEFVVENLVTHQKQTVHWKKPLNQIFHPYCDSLLIKSKRLIIWNNHQAHSFPIRFRP